MNATEVMAAIEKLSIKEQEQVLTLLARKVIARHERTVKTMTGVNFYFDGTYEAVFQENKEFPGLLAKS